MIRMLLVMVLSALGLASLCAPVAAQDKKEPSPKEKPASSLKVGDPAPALKATRAASIAWPAYSFALALSPLTLWTPNWCSRWAARSG